jgi:hypothetical protein
MFCCFFLQALPNQGTVDYPSFKLVIVGDGGTGEFPNGSVSPLVVRNGRSCRCFYEIWQIGLGRCVQSVDIMPLRIIVAASHSVLTTSVT